MLQSMGSQRVGQGLVTKQQQQHGCGLRQGFWFRVCPTDWLGGLSRGYLSSRWESPPSQGRRKQLETLVCSREGNGNPLQYSRLENPMDGGAW